MHFSPFEAGQYVGYIGGTFSGKSVTQSGIHTCKDEGKLTEEFGLPFVVGHQMGIHLKSRLENLERTNTDV
jgi:hypothetical protein